MSMEQPAQLTAKQIQKLFDFTKENHVNYIDVQYELVDHLASGIEEQLKSNPTLDFELAINNERQKFPLTGFYHFVEQKEKALYKYWKRKIWSITMSYFRLPQLLLTLAIFLSVYLFYLKCSVEITISIGLILTLASMLCYSVMSYRNKSKYLFIKQFYAALNIVPGLAMAYFYSPNYNFFAGPVKLPTIWIVLPQHLSATWYAASVSLMLIFLIGAVTGKFRKILMDELHQKYSHLSLAS